MTVEVSLGPLSLGGDYYSVDGDGTRWCATDWPGPGSPASSVDLTQKPSGPGGWLTPGQMTGRSVTMNGWVTANSPALLRSAFDQLNAAVAVDQDVPLSVTVDGEARWLLVRRQGEVVPAPTSAVSASWSIQVVAADPRWMADPMADETGLPSSTGGITFPITFPLTFTETVLTGAVSLNNPGNMSGPVVVRVDGPCTGPIITHSGSGKRLVLGTELVLAQGEFITVDMENELVLAQGQARRNGWVIERGWSSFDPGANTWSFTSQGSFNSLARMSVVAWPSWQ